MEFGSASGLVAAGDGSVEDAIAVDAGYATCQNLTLILDLYCLHRGLQIILFHIVFSFLFLFLVHSNQDIDEDSPNGRIDQSDEGGEHGGIVEEVNNIHIYGF